MLADHLTNLLGQTFLDAHIQLRTAVEDLRAAVEADQQSKLGKVVSESGNCLQHGANTAVVVGASNAVASFLQRITAG